MATSDAPDQGFTPFSEEDRKVIAELMREIEEHNGMRCRESSTSRPLLISQPSNPAVHEDKGGVMAERMCKRCGHPQSWHRHDDTNVQTFRAPTDPECKFRCIGYDCEVAGKPPKNPCNCPDFEEE